MSDFLISTYTNCSCYISNTDVTDRKYIFEVVKRKIMFFDFSEKCQNCIDILYLLLRQVLSAIYSKLFIGIQSNFTRFEFRSGPLAKHANYTSPSDSNWNGPFQGSPDIGHSQLKGTWNNNQSILILLLIVIQLNCIYIKNTFYGRQVVQGKVIFSTLCNLGHKCTSWSKTVPNETISLSRWLHYNAT